MDDPEQSSGSPESKQQAVSPSISLPKGGGAIRGMGEKFAANPVTGTGSMSVPIATSPGRSGFGPQLSISYDSGAGNGPFGFGWSLSLPSITRKTDKGLPRYFDSEESDAFILSGAEDLVPVLDSNGQPLTLPDRTFQENGMERTYRIKRYRPRIEGLFARIERWTNVSEPWDIHWRSISRDNILTIYGLDNRSRIFDPVDIPQSGNLEDAKPTRIFNWLISETRDDKGNTVLYEYKAEDDSGVVLSQANERNRVRTANRYLKRIYYGNRKPLLDDSGSRLPFLAHDQVGEAGWMFEVVFDYDEGHYTEDVPDGKGQVFATAQIDPPANAFWPVRNDPFSSYRSGFEVRTYRLCQRVLMFHHIPDLPTGEQGYDGLVRSTDFTYEYEMDPDNARSPIYSFLQQVTLSGYKPANGSYLKQSMPPVEFEYTKPVVQDTVEEVDSESLENMPFGIDGTAYQWTDLHGEGIPGILTEQGGEWFYKRNISPIPDNMPDGSEIVAARFAPMETVALKPNAALNGGAAFMDLAGDGLPDLVMLEGPTPGLYEHDEAEGWQQFRPFTSRLNRNMQDPNLKLVDLDGDGHADVLISEDDAFVWHSSLAEEGFGPASRVAQAFDEENGPRLVFADGTESIYLADLSGDGLTDLVRVRNGEVCYWPNLGYCRFGAKVTMDNAPWFDNPDQFDQKRIRLADIDGTGTTDIIYLHRDCVRFYFNQSGNSWSEPQQLHVFPRIDNLVSVMTADLLGNGTACLVWSSPQVNDGQRPMRYVNLMGGQKPHLLIKTINNLGAETRVDYAPSTKFYLQDKRDGTPWITRLPFPVHVVERVETYDQISKNRFVSRYAYHHGYYDGMEREFRGFGKVEQWDTEEYAILSATGELTPDGQAGTANEAITSHMPPVHTVTWFHTGTYLGGSEISLLLAQEYYGAPLPGETDFEQKFSDFINRRLLPDTILPPALPVEEAREACRSLKGAMLRQEVYAEDGTDKAQHPYTVTEQNFTIRSLQPRGDNRHAVFFTHAREAVSYHYEREPQDPRMTHAMTLEVDDFGNVLTSAAIGYGRSVNAPDEQKLIHITCTENSFTNAITDEADVYRTPLPSESRTYELRKAEQEQSPDGEVIRYGLEEMLGYVKQAGDGSHDINYDDIHFSEAQETDSYFRRPIEHVRTLYRDNALTGPLALHELDSLALPYESYQLAFTDELLNKIFQRPHTNQPDDKLLPDDPAEMLAAGNPGEAISGRGGYVKLALEPEDQNRWWIPSGQVFFSPGENDTPQAELTEARQHFFIPRRYRNPFGHPATVTFDQYDLLMQETHDALGNTVLAENDYRVLQPELMTDPNGNRSAVAFDTLGMVAGTAVMGKAGEMLGDMLDDFKADLSQTQINDFFNVNEPHKPAPAQYKNLLNNATTRIVYDLDRYRNTGRPVFAATIVRETHVSDLQPGQEMELQVSFSYSDGFGREIQKKIQAEPGPLDVDDPNAPPVDPRWVGSGWTVFNNKGKPVRQYEPFFDDTHDFRFGKAVGVSPVLFYDPVGRVIATLHPNHTYEKVVFDPWQQTTYDVNDTCAPRDPQTGDPRTDPDIGGYVAEYFKSQPPDWQTWYQQRIGGALGTVEETAAEKTAAHADTPTTAHFDSLGRPFLTIDRNRVICPNHEDDGTEAELLTNVELDIEGNQRSVTDAKDRVVMRYDYNMLGTVIHQASMEAGERWLLNDVSGKPIRTWDSRGFNHRMEYDALRRPRAHYVAGNGQPELQVEKTVYGDTPYDGTPETLEHPEQTNHRGKPYKVYDNAGVVTSETYDFKGNLWQSNRQLRHEYKKTADWQQNPELEQEIFRSRTWYDALNRPLQFIAPHSDQDGTKFDIIRPGYNEANLLERVEVWSQQQDEPGSLLDTDTAGLHAVKNIDYDAKGQRQRIEYGNGAMTRYSYDPETYRLIRLLTTRPTGGDGLAASIFSNPDKLQDLHYTYDPAGNITRIEDAALKTTFHSGQIDPVSRYTYDALYRLVEAKGREQIGQCVIPVEKTNTRDYPFTGYGPQTNDPQALRIYTERYVYDEVGNFENLIHQANGGSWQRDYFYEEASLLDGQTDVSNRLTRTVLHPNGNNPVVEPYKYDTHGNMTAMPHLTLMQWDFRDQFYASSKQVVNNGGTPETTYYVYDGRGQRVRKVTENYAAVNNDPTRKNERIYLGGFEVYREYNGNGAPLKKERLSLHVMDDKQRIALVETKTFDANSNEGLGVGLVRYQLANHLGSASLELDGDGALISYEEYHPYGTTAFQVHRGEVSAKRYRYTGMERDEETGLNYHGARYYALWLGRWCSCDPIVIDGGINLYLMTLANPIVYADSSGNEPVSSRVIEVHVRPKGMENISEWAYVPGRKVRLYSNREQFNSSLSEGVVRFRYNPNAPRRNIVFLERAESENMLQEINQAVRNATTSFDQPESTAQQSNNTGENNRTLSEGEKAAQELASVGGILALALQDEVPNRTGGMAGGMNESVPTDSATQAAVASLQIVLSIGSEAKNFLKLLKQAATAGAKNIIFRGLTSETAEAIMRNPRYARYMAPYFSEAGHIGRYSALKAFTKGHGDYHAHHIIETRVLKRLFGWSDEAATQGPAIILTQAEHTGFQGIHRRLEAELSTEAIEHMSKQEILGVYEKVYREAGYEHLIPTVREFFKGANVAR